MSVTSIPAEMLEELVAKDLHGARLLEYSRQDDGTTPALDFVVLWQRIEIRHIEYGTHRAFLCKATLNVSCDRKGHLVWGHYHRDIRSAVNDYYDRAGLDA